MLSDSSHVLTPQLDPVTLSRFIIEEERADGIELSLILQSVALASKVISSAISKAGIKGLDGEWPCPKCCSYVAGLHGIVNVQGEEQQKLDILSNTVMINVLKSTGVVC